MEAFLEYFDVGGEVEGKVTRNEFVNYYTNIGACIDDDEYFNQIVRGVWKVSGSSPSNNNDSLSSMLDQTEGGTSIHVNQYESNQNIVNGRSDKGPKPQYEATGNYV